MKPADLKPGQHRIVTADMGNLAVTSVFDDLAASVREGCPELGRVFVDVVPDRHPFTPEWDAEKLPAATGAEMFQWLGLSPLRYRLAFKPDTDVAVEPE